MNHISQLKASLNVIKCHAMHSSHKHYSVVLIISGLCSLFYYALKDDQPAPTKCVGFRERDGKIKKAPVKHRLSSDSSQVPKIVKKAQVSSLKPSVKRHMSSKGGGSEQGREREGDHSALSKSCDLQVAPPPHASKSGQKRSLSGSSMSDDSLSPPLIKVNQRCTSANEHMYKVCVCVCVCIVLKHSFVQCDKVFIQNS